MAWRRIAGVLGILGGLVLLAAFAPGLEMSREVNTVRLVLFNAGAIAVALAVHRRQATVAPRLSATTAGAVVLANAAFLVLVSVGVGRPQPPDPDPAFRLVGFLAGAAMWWANAAFGLVAWHLRSTSRWGSAALAIGSILAFLGIDRLELATGDLAWLVQPVALAGIGLSGVGWVVLGHDLLVRGRGVDSSPAQGPVLSG